MKLKKVLEVVKKGRAHIAKHWIRNAERIYNPGRTPSPASLSGVCSIGAMGVGVDEVMGIDYGYHSTEEGRELYKMANNELLESIRGSKSERHYRDIPNWNDNYAEHSDVLEAFDNTISRLEDLCAVENAASAVAEASQSLGAPPPLPCASDAGGASSTGSSCGSSALIPKLN